MRPEDGFDGLVKDVTSHSTVIVMTVNWAADPLSGVYVPRRERVPARFTASGATVRV